MNLVYQFTYREGLLRLVCLHCLHAIVTHRLQELGNEYVAPSGEIVHKMCSFWPYYCTCMTHSLSQLLKMLTARGPIQNALFL